MTSTHKAASRRLLLVEDDLEIAQDLVEDLLGHSFHLTHAANGIEGLAVAQGGVFAVIVVDWMMPGMDR